MSDTVYMVRNTKITEETLKFAEMMELLRAGKKVKTSNLNIEYIFLHPQTQELYAHLKDGFETKYDFSIFDVGNQYVGEYVKEVPKQTVTIEYMPYVVSVIKYGTCGLLMGKETKEYPMQSSEEAILGDICHEYCQKLENYAGNKEVDLLVTFAESDTKLIIPYTLLKDVKSRIECGNL